jgi:release factor glutamine methyltransferase
MNRGQALAGARRALAEAGIEEAPLEGEVLLRHVLDMTRAGLFAGLDGEMTPGQEQSLRGLLQRRIRGEPSAYITGRREFYGLEFYVDSNVLIPRPETELLVDKAIGLARGARVSGIADIGTGSGAIAVSLAVNLPGVSIYAADISAAGLEVARRNARRHGVETRISFRRGHLLEPLPGPVDMIIANLPYVRRSDLRRAGPLSYEPALALDGGEDGLDLIRMFCRQADTKLRRGGFLLMEVGEGQAGKAARLLREAYPLSKVEIDRDLAGIERVLSLTFDRVAGTMLN